MYLRSYVIRHGALKVAVKIMCWAAGSRMCVRASVCVSLWIRVCSTLYRVHPGYTARREAGDFVREGCSTRVCIVFGRNEEDVWECSRQRGQVGLKFKALQTTVCPRPVSPATPYAIGGWWRLLTMQGRGTFLWMSLRADVSWGGTATWTQRPLPPDQST